MVSASAPTTSTTRTEKPFPHTRGVFANDPKCTKKRGAREIDPRFRCRVVIPRLQASTISKKPAAPAAPAITATSVASTVQAMVCSSTQNEPISSAKAPTLISNPQARPTNQPTDLSGPYQNDTVYWVNSLPPPDSMLNPSYAQPMAPMAPMTSMAPMAPTPASMAPPSRPASAFPSHGAGANGANVYNNNNALYASSSAYPPPLESSLPPPPIYQNPLGNQPPMMGTSGAFQAYPNYQQQGRGSTFPVTTFQNGASWTVACGGDCADIATLYNQISGLQERVNELTLENNRLLNNEAQLKIIFQTTSKAMSLVKLSF